MGRNPQHSVPQPPEARQPRRFDRRTEFRTPQSEADPHDQERSDAGGQPRTVRHPSSVRRPFGRSRASGRRRWQQVAYRLSARSPFPRRPVPVLMRQGRKGATRSPMVFLHRQTSYGCTNRVAIPREWQSSCNALEFDCRAARSTEQHELSTYGLSPAARFFLVIEHFARNDAGTRISGQHRARSRFAGHPGASPP